MQWTPWRPACFIACHPSLACLSAIPCLLASLRPLVCFITCHPPLACLSAIPARSLVCDPPPIRYLKRGVNDVGHVANEVEVEQMLVEQHVRMDPCDCNDGWEDDDDSEEKERHDNGVMGSPAAWETVQVSSGSENCEGIGEEAMSVGSQEGAALTPAVGTPCPAHVYISHMSAVVQVRGSVPLFWSQEASGLTPKPDIARTYGVMQC